MSSNLTRFGNYKAHNIIHKVNYWRSKGEDPSFLFDGLDLDYWTLKETDWLDYETQVKVIWENERKKVPNPRDHEPLGYTAYLNQSMGVMEVFAKLVDLNTIFRQFVRLSRQYSHVEFYDIYSLKRNRAVLVYGPKKAFLDEFSFASPCFVAGFLKALPKIYEPSFPSAAETVEDAHVEMRMSCFNPKTIIQSDYAFICGDKLEVQDQEGLLLINNEVYGHRINLATEFGKDGLWQRIKKTFIREDKETGLIYAGRKGDKLSTIPNPLDRSGTGILITRDLIVDNVLVLRKGEIHDAPYCRFDVAWSPIPHRARAKYVIQDLPIATKSSRQKLLEQIEVADERYFSEMKARQRAEEAEREERLAKERLQDAHQQLQAYAENLEVLVAEKSAQLIEEEKMRRIYQVRAAQANAVARFLHQTSNLVLQPLASTMIVFEDFIDIIEDIKDELLPEFSEDELYQELDDSLVRVKETYPAASQVIDGYRELFHAFYQVYVSAESLRDINQDLRFIETLVRNKYILTSVELELDLDPSLPKIKLEAGVQSIFLELLQNAAKQGARRLLVRSEVDEKRVRFKIYNDGPPVSEDARCVLLRQDVTEEGRGFGLADARYVVETLNGGTLRLSSSDRNTYTTMFEVTLMIDGD